MKKKKIALIAIEIVILILVSVAFFVVGRSSKISQEIKEKHILQHEEILEASCEISKNKGLLNRMKEFHEKEASYEKALDDVKHEYNEVVVNIKQKEREKSELEKTISKLTGQVEDIKYDPITLGAGKYKVGTDITEGIYDLKWEKGRGNLFVSDLFGELQINEIFGNDDSFYIKEYRNADLKAGGTIEINGNVKIKFIRK